jgi:hypothetical protein
MQLAACLVVEHLFRIAGNPGFFGKGHPGSRGKRRRELDTGAQTRRAYAATLANAIS